MPLPLNYAFIFGEIKYLLPGRDSDYKVLDYGCGKGLLVEEGRKNNMDIYGVELFSHGSGLDIKDSLDEKKLLGKRVYEMSDNQIPFPDNTFDMVVSNTVFEHIPDMSVALREINRVLKKEGKFLNLFPYKGMIREGHSHIPFVHRFPPESRLQYYWLYSFKLLRLGRRKKEKDPAVWANYWSTWIRENTFYLSLSQIKTKYENSGFEFKHIEDRYIVHRLNCHNHNKLSTFFNLHMMRPFSRWVCRKYGGLVLMAHKE